MNNQQAARWSVDRPRNDLFLRAAGCEHTERPPVWLMRQAGRFDPAYLDLRAKCGLELEDLFVEPKLAAEITLLPKRLGVDALILFQDILTPLGPMGAPFVFRPGPVLAEPVRDSEAVDRLVQYDPNQALDCVPDSISRVLKLVDGELPLLGFAGAPLTLATFLIEGGSAGSNVGQTRSFLRRDPQAMHRLLERLADMTGQYLSMQIGAGVHGVQLFESMADLFSAEEYAEFAQPYQGRVFSQISTRCPRMLFAKEINDVNGMASTGANVVSVGGCVDLVQARASLGNDIAIQGNVDNQILLNGTEADVESATLQCVEAGGNHGHIVNLNHGILKETPFDNVVRMIDTVRGLSQTLEREGSRNAASI